jgi:MFS family permease
LVARFGQRRVVSSGLAIVALGLLVLSRSTVDGNYAVLAAGLMIAALGMGLTTAPSTGAIMQSLPLPKAGVFAHKQAGVVAENIARAIAGQVQSARFDGHGDCFIEIGGGKAGFGGGDFYAEPKPAVTLRLPSWRWHLGKVWVEKTWLYTKL